MRGRGFTHGRTHGDTAPSFKEFVTAAICAVGATAAYTSMASWHGALGAARSDDWAYYRSAYALARDGSFTADPWVDTMLVGHVAIAQPVISLFGPSVTALQLMVATLGAVALLSTYWVTRSYLSRGQAALATGCLAVGPIYGSLSVSYMTDVPAYALEVLVLLTGLNAMRDGAFSFRWFIASLSLGVVAFSIREYALAAPAAVALIAMRHAAGVSRARLRRVAILVLLGLLAAASMYVWRHSLPGSSHVSRPPQTVLIAITYGLSAIFTVSLFAFPTVFVISVRTARRAVRARPRTSLTTASVAVAAWVWLLVTNGSVLMGNMLTLQGSFPETLPGPAPVVVPELIWEALSILSLYSLIMLTAVRMTMDLDRRSDGARTSPSSTYEPGLQLSRAFSLLMFGELLAVKFATPGVITDRYLFPLVPFVAAVALSHAARKGLLVRRTRSMGLASLAMLALLGAAVVDAAATFDGAKWQFAASLERSGVRAESIDGGYEWFGYHQPGQIVDFALDAPARNWWNRLFHSQDLCIETRHEASPSVPASEAGVGPILARYRARTAFGVNYNLVAVRLKDQCSLETR